MAAAIETTETVKEIGIDDAVIAEMMKRRKRIETALGTGIETVVIEGRTIAKEIEIVPGIGIVIEIAIGILIEAAARNVKQRRWTWKRMLRWSRSRGSVKRNLVASVIRLLSPSSHESHHS